MDRHFGAPFGAQRSAQAGSGAGQGVPARNADQAIRAARSLTLLNLTRIQSGRPSIHPAFLGYDVRSFRGDASRTQRRGVQSPLCVRCAATSEVAEAHRVRSDRQMPRLCRQPGNRTAGAGKTTRRRGPIRAIGQSQRVGRSNPQRARRGNEPSFPRPGWGQHTPGSSAAVGISTAANALDPSHSTLGRKARCTFIPRCRSLFRR